jgi:hypothetical protein
MRFWILALFCFLGALVITTTVPDSIWQTQQLRSLAREFQDALGIPETVSVSIVETNPRLASVRPSPQRKDSYLLEVDEAFLGTLSQQEQRAVVAHEIGHVWIFTHFPYLQSEALANQKAELLVSQASLIQVYERVWQLDGRPNSLGAYLETKMGINTFGASSSDIPALGNESAEEPE